MWAVDNQTGFAADRCFVRDIDGAEIWLVGVRATFDIHPDGKITPSKEQEPVCLFPEYLGEPGKSSLRCDLDLPRTKLGTDVLLNGSAYAPDGVATQTVDVTLRVGPIDKSLVVYGVRTWKRDLLGTTTTEPQPFIRCPITYEKSFGGPYQESLSRSQQKASLSNPVGSGFDTKNGQPAPQIEQSGSVLSSAGAPVAGFGAIGPSWMPRRNFAGTYDEKWENTRQPLLPLDFDNRYFYSAPPDQQVPGYLKGGEAVELKNLTPSGHLSFRLPRLSFGFRTVIDGGTESHRANLITVLIEPDQMRLYMVWHTSLPCHHTLYTLKHTTVFEKTRILGQQTMTA